MPTMENNEKNITAKEMTQIPAKAKEQASQPCNCRSVCPYGKGRDFCFPCYGKIMNEYRKKRG